MTGNTGGFGVDAPTVGDIADDAVADGDGRSSAFADAPVARVVVVVFAVNLGDDFAGVAGDDEVDAADISRGGP